MKVLVTGANGFAGSWLIRRLLAEGHEVVGAAGGERGWFLTSEERARIRWVPLELDDPGSVRAAAAVPADWVAHLAGLASVAESFRDPERAWTVNAIGTVRLLDALLARRREGGFDPVVLVVSSAEVYGTWIGDGAPRPRRETDPVAPISPYGASKAAAELAALEAWRRAGLRVVIARAFPHTGVGQAPHFVVPGFLARVQDAKRAGRRTVTTGDLRRVRDFLDVRDVADAYARLLAEGEPGETYNVASGHGVALETVLATAGALLDWAVVPEPDPALARPTDIPHLVGDPGKLRARTGWQPRYGMEATLEHMLHAQAH